MNYSEAKNLLSRYGLMPDRIRHSEGVSETAYVLANRISSLHPELKIRPDIVKIAGLLHDIGRSKEEGSHVINSIKILQHEGLYEIAPLVKHGVAYEYSKLEGNEDKNLIPDTVENKIVAYSDTRFRLFPVTLDERIEDIRIRKKNNEKRLAVLEMSIDRIKQMEKEILSLAELDKNDPILKTN